MSGRSRREATPPDRCAVVLGASNVARSITAVIDVARAAWGAPLDMMFACGHGRSYGMDSWVLGRGLPGIVPCGLWRALDERPPAPTAALLTDIGNDILYGATVDQIIGWVEICLDRLAPRCERLVVTELPLASIGTLGPRRFALMRTILFPSCRLERDEALRRAEQLNERLTQIADRYQATLIKPPPSWYGFDPIHIRLPLWSDAWRAILRSWSDQELGELKPHDWLRWIRLRCLRPQERTMFGIRQRRRQPAAVLSDGTWLSFY